MYKANGETPPVFKLGAGVLSLIFAESARKETVIHLTLVCSFFRDILQHLPRLFSAICITTRSKRLRPPSSVFGLHFYSIRSSNRLSTLLERAENTPLEIMIDFPLFIKDGASDQIQQRAEALSMLTTLCRHSNRWETLVVYSVILFLDEPGLQEALPGPFEKLKRLSLRTHFQLLMESMKHWLPQIHVLYVEPQDEGQLETLSEFPWLSGIHALTLKYDDDTLVTSSTIKLLHACRTLCSLHIYGACVEEEDSFGTITLDSLTELTLSCRSIAFPLSSLQTPALTSLTINEWVSIGDVDLHYPCLKRLSITTNEPLRIFNHLPVRLYDSLFFNFLDVDFDPSQIERLIGIKARRVTIHRSLSPEETFISMLEAMSGVLEELELVEVRVASNFIDLFSKRDQCVRTVREVRLRTRQFQRWIWTPSAGWDFLGM